ncbi:MAG: SDR family NAD(P)-dependent oxidoreductase [Pseudomonadota bacterium]|jgi:NAD(P)-dependent dehydrogenase (short-subunit alcohol dehydrogenase family)
MAGRYQGKVAVITGGASGIGAATVRKFVSEGAKVVIADMQEEMGRKLAGELGANVHFQKTDVTREAEVKAAVEGAVAKFGRLDCIFNNAGFGGAAGPVETISVEDYDITMDVLVKGVFLGIKHAAPILKAQGSGTIVNTASIAAFYSGIGPVLYNAAKAAVLQMTKSMALEFGYFGVRVNCVCPGIIATPLAAGRAGAPQEVIDKMRESLGGDEGEEVLRRIGNPEEIADAVFWLASDESSYVNGHALVVDGGRTAGLPYQKQTNWLKKPRELRLYRPEGR